MARDYQLKPHDSGADDQPPQPAEEDAAARHVAILRSLAEGNDPLTGDELPDESLYQSAKVLRALQAAVTSLEKDIERRRKRGQLPGKAGNPWTPEEEAKLVQRFEAGLKIEALAEEHGRTAGAIASRLAKLGKLEG